MMNDHDLIAALAEGRLSGHAAENAAARIKADPELSSEYAAQVAALTFLSSARVPEMTAAERSMLHMNLTEQLGLSPKTTQAHEPAQRKTPWWAPVFGLATAAAVVAAFVILPGTLFGGASDTASMDLVSADLESSSAEASPTTAAAASDGALEAPADDAPTAAEEREIPVYDTDSVGLDELLKQAQGAASPGSVL